MTLVGKDRRKACCQVEANLGPEERLGARVTFRRCAVCGCRHFTATLPALRVQVRRPGESHARG